MICPCGTYTYKFRGTGLTGDFSAWGAGALAEQTIEQNFVVVERRTFTWGRSEAISPDAVPGQEGIWTDDAIYTALPVQQAVIRGSHTATTTFEYHATNFNDYGQPWRIHYTGDFTRRVDRLFQHAFTPYIRGRVTREEVWVGGGMMVLMTRQYDPATGFVTSAYDQGGAGHSFEQTAQANGNVGAVIDDLGNRTTFTYNWGLVSQVRTQENVVTTSVINPNGTIASVTQDPLTNYPLTTSYGYDAAFCVQSVTPPGAPGIQPLPTTYTYDNVWGAWVRADHGDTNTETRVDGFGRFSSTDTEGLKTRVSRDACGRVTFESAPFTTGAGNRGVTTAYDALNRVTQVTDALSNLTQYAYSGIDVTVTDAESRQTFYDYSAAGDVRRLVKVRDAAQQETNYQYTASDQLYQVTGPGTTPPRTWIWDGAGRLLSDTQPESGTTTYVHNIAGLLTQRTDAENRVITYTYDGDQRPRTINLPGTSDDVTITYDLIGRVISQATPGVSTTFAYDSVGRLASRTDTVSGHAPFVSSYGYDLKGNLTSITYPSGRQVTYEHDCSTSTRMDRRISSSGTA